MENAASSTRTGVLRANTDDPRFTNDVAAEPARRADWTGTSAIVADLTEPLDTAGAMVNSPVGVLVLVESALEAVFEALGSLVGNLLSHWH